MERTAETYLEMGEGEDLHANENDEMNLNSMMDYVDNHNDGIDEDLLVDVVEDPSLFYGEFPPLPDFQCIPSSSSSSSSSCLTPAPLKPMLVTCSSTSSSSASAASSSSSSSAASWAILKSDEADDDHGDAMDLTNQQPSDCNGINDVDCMDAVDTFGYMDLIGSNEIWGNDEDRDPCAVFENDLLQFNQQPQSQSQTMVEQRQEDVATNRNDEQNGGELSEDLAMVFFEWLKSNKESISAEDLRNIKLKRSTIECAVKRLGGGKDGMKRLFKLILEWVQNHQLHHQPKKTNTIRTHTETEAEQPHLFHQNSQFLNIPNPSNQIYTNPLVPPQDPNNWNFPVSPPPQLPPSFVAAPVMADDSSFQSMVGYLGDPMMNYNQHEQVFGSVSQVWPQSPFANIPPPPPPTQGFTGYENQHTYQYFPGNGEKLVRLGSSATKEARQRRMARQRRLYSHHRHNHGQNQNQINQQLNQEHLMNQIGNDPNCTNDPLAPPPGNWVYWPSSAGPSVASSQQVIQQPDFPLQSQSPDRSMILQSQNYQRQEKRQGWKQEKNLRFLLQKVLKQSDVGNLGRIVLPKKEAETHLPELDARDGISIPMEDIGTSRVWNMRYRFWPNNKSRMYLLENTGEFVRANGLQEGDFIVIYSDVKCGKYMIRGVKVRQPGPKMETKKSGKAHRNQHNQSGNNGHPSSSTKMKATNNINDEMMKKNEKKSNKQPTLFYTDSMKIDGNICG